LLWKRSGESSLKQRGSLAGNLDYCIFFLLEKGIIIKMAIDKIKAITPPSLLGIDRKIA